jgi:hypothetical protein
MNYEPLNRRLATLSAILAFVGVILGVIALATNYWTLTFTTHNLNETLDITTGYNRPVWNVGFYY